MTTEAVQWVSPECEAQVDAAGLILMYHRVADSPFDPWGLTVSPIHFGQHLEVLREFGQPLPLTRAVEATQDRSLPRRTLVVTFDDGYADNLHNAKPLLERHGIPATVFVTSGYVGSARGFWWGELEAILLQCVDLPGELQLSASGRLEEWILGEARSYSEDTRRSDRDHHAAGQGAPSPRYAFYLAVHRVLMPLPENERRGLLDHLRCWAGAANGAFESPRCLSADEVVALKSSGLVEIGAHTVSHAMLSSLSVAGQSEEIRRSKQDLERIAGRPVTNFAYPYGAYSPTTAALTREAGFSSACSTRAGVLMRNCDPYCLPRVKVGDWNGERLEKVLAEWFKRAQ